MATRTLKKSEKQFFEKLGKRLGKIILDERGFNSLDAFSLEHSEEIAKPTIYQLVDGKRDPKVSTLLRLAKALGMSLEELIRDL